MSSRRSAGEDNILAMLERDAARRNGVRLSSARLAWYGAAAALAGILAGGIAWLAYDNQATGRALQLRYDAANSAPPVLASATSAAAASPSGLVAHLPEAPPALPSAPPAMVTAPDIDAGHAAVIVDETARASEPKPAPRAGARLETKPAPASVPASAPASAPGQAVPPLVMLPPRELAGKKEVAAPARSAPQAARVAPTVAAPPRATQARAPAPEAVRSAADKDKKRERTSRPERAASSSNSKPGAGKTIAQRATRTRQAAPPAAAPVDSDVALISAIIEHAERHRGEQAAPDRCSGPACPARPGRR